MRGPGASSDTPPGPLRPCLARPGLRICQETATGGPWQGATAWPQHGPSREGETVGPAPRHGGHCGPSGSWQEATAWPRPGPSPVSQTSKASNPLLARPSGPPSTVRAEGGHCGPGPPPWGALWAQWVLAGGHGVAPAWTRLDCHRCGAPTTGFRPW